LPPAHEQPAGDVVKRSNRRITALGDLIDLRRGLVERLRVLLPRRIAWIAWPIACDSSSWLTVTGRA
jgi:hypothetical protein